MPVRLRVLAGRREFVKTTGARDNAVGKLVAAVLLADWRQQLFKLEGGRLDDTKILKLVDGAPALAVGGFVSLRRAADLLGLALNDLLRAAAAGRLTLHCGIGRDFSDGSIVPLAALEPVDAEAGRAGGVVVPDLKNMPPEAQSANMQGQTLQVSDSQEIAGAILADGLSLVELVALEAPGRPGWLFAPNKTICIEVEALVVPTFEVEALRVISVAAVSTERIEHARAARMVKIEGGNASAGKWADKRFSEGVEAYCMSKDGLSKNLADEHEQRQRKNGLLLFAEFMGDLQLSEIDGDTLRAFRDGPLKDFPDHLNRMKKSSRRDTMSATIEALKAGDPGYKRMTVAQQQERMRSIFRLFSWLFEKTYLMRDPAVSLRGETGMSKAERIVADRIATEDDDEEGRRPFNDGELKSIFGITHYRTGNGAHITKGNEAWRPFEFWLPLLGLYAGCRIKEAAQLHLADVVQIDGVWCLDINRRTADKSLKTDASVRRIPLHTQLIAIGFVDYCERLRKEGFFRVFPELTYALSPAKYGKEPGRRMSEMLKKIGMPRDGTLVYHCLRHNLNNALARVPMAALMNADEKLRIFVRYRVIGHELPEDVNAKHYTATTAVEMATLVNGVKYDLPGPLSTAA